MDACIDHSSQDSKYSEHFLGDIKEAKVQNKTNTFIYMTNRI